MRLVNGRTEEVIASAVALATTRRERRQGLLGRRAFGPSEALVLSPCFMIHTAFMRFAIDVLFVDRRGAVVMVAQDVRPWRASMSARAHSVVELPAGTLRSVDVRIGDPLRVC